MNRLMNMEVSWQYQLFDTYDDNHQHKQIRQQQT